MTKQSYALYAKLWDHHSLSGFVMTYGHLLSNGPQVTKVSFKPVLIFQKKGLKIMEEHTVKNSALRMTWAVDPAHGRDIDSRNVPGRRRDYFPLFTANFDKTREKNL